MVAYLPLFNQQARRSYPTAKLAAACFGVIALCAVILPHTRVGRSAYSTVFPPPGGDCVPPHLHDTWPDDKSDIELELEPQTPDATPHPPTKAVTSELLSLDEINMVVSQTDGRVLVRDWDLGLGWNNMRYIIETGLALSKSINRTLVLPSFVYARGCEYDYHVCGDYVPMVNRGDAVGNDEWRELPIAQQMGWRIPIEVMLNITLLREHQPVITVGDFLHLHGLPYDLEKSNGYWRREEYAAQANVFTNKTPTFGVIENGDWDPRTIVRVNEIPKDWQSRLENEQFSTELDSQLREKLDDDKMWLPWDRVEKVIGSKDVNDTIHSLRQAGWEALYTWDSIVGLDYNKAVVEPILQAAPLSVLRGFINDFHSREEDILLIAGGIHYGRKPGSLLYTTHEAAQEFAKVPLYELQRRNEMVVLAETLVGRMDELAKGRQWMAAHMRRGDFVRYGWVMENTPEAHIGRVKKRLAEGREVLNTLQTAELKTFDIPGDVQPDTSFRSRGLPQEGDWFYVATDERDPKVLEYFREQGAVFMDDLLTINDRRRFGKEADINWALMITDIRALVEQVIMARSAFFYGHAMSSVPGSVLNMRATRGADPRTHRID